MSLIKTRNPNPFPIGIKFGFLKYGGRYKTRTCDLPHVKRMRYQLRQSSKSIGECYYTTGCAVLSTAKCKFCKFYLGGSTGGGFVPPPAVFAYLMMIGQVAVFP